MSTANPTIHVSKILVVGVPVTDQDRALDFYTGTLGFTTRMDVPIGNGARWLVVSPSQGTDLALVASGGNLPAGVHTGVRLVVGDVEADHVALAAAGVDVDEILRWPGVPLMFDFRDPDGNTLELVEEAPAR